MCERENKCKDKFFKVYHCNNEYYKISLNVDIDYDTFDIIYSVINESSTSFNGIVEVCSSMLGSKKCKKLFNVDETITFEGNLTDSIIYNGEFKEDISVAYLRFPESKEFCNFVMSNTVTIKPQDGPIPPPPPNLDNWIYNVSFVESSLQERVITVSSSLNSKDEAKDIVVELVYPRTMGLGNVNISSQNTYPEEITLEQDKFVFRIPSLLPGDIRVYRFSILSPANRTIGTVMRIKSSTPFLFQPNQQVIYRVS